MLLALALSFTSLASASDGLQPRGRMVPFVVPAIDSWDNATNIAWLNEKPAGKHGFVAVKGGHFADGAGKRIRFIGGAFAHGASFPTHEMADRIAARLAMTGFNLVRLHHMDGRLKPNGIWRKGDGGKPEIDPEQLDRLMYLIAALKRQGVYVNVNLKVSRTFRDSEGCVEANKLGRFSKGPDYFDPRMIELQKQYARDLLTHLNPYTKTRLVEEPSVAFVEMNNENSLLGHVLGGKLDPLPRHYAKQLDTKWVAWLKKHYGSSTRLREAWGATNEPLGDNMLKNGDFAKGKEAWSFSVRDPQTGVASVSNDGPEGQPALHVKALKPGKLQWTFQVHQVHLDLQDDKLYTLSFWMKAKQPTTVQCTVRLDHAGAKTGRFRIVGLNRRIKAPAKWQRFEFAFKAVDPVKNGNRVGFTFPNTPGEYWITDMQLRPGGAFGMEENEDLATENVSRPVAPSALPARDARWLDYVNFITELDQGYACGMYRYLKDDLGVKCPVIDTQASYGGIAGILRESQLDYVDMHAYWDHPRFPHKSWDVRDWLVHNRPMVASEGGGIIQRLACHRVVGKPFVVSEFNEPSPTWYAAECWPIVAACAAVQDWDGIIVHNYVNYGCEDWGKRRIGNFFDTATHPAKMPLVLAAAMMFLRGDVPAAKASATVDVPAQEAPRLSATLRGGVELWQSLASVDANMLVSTRLGLRFVSNAGKPALHTTPGRGSVVRWDAKGRLFTVDAPATKAIVGFVAKRRITLGPWSVEFGKSTNGFAVATLTALDGEPIEKSSKLVVAVLGAYGNTGMKWRTDQAMLASWGRAPSLLEAVPAAVRLNSRVTGLKAYALDGKGNRVKPVAAHDLGGGLALDVGPARGTAWYELSAE